ncbi:MAG: LysE family translocator [Bacteroidales bacterium]|jgi:threonine/homoserine/homoserine lactone efflux protein|nr:LysE family translocator [Bacteroidales bacterium]
MNIWGFIATAIVLTIMPGPDILFVLTQSISRGKKAGMVFAAGLCTGLIFHIAALSLGLSVLIKESPDTFILLKVFGAAYLVFLGIKSFLGRNKASFRLNYEKIDSRKLYTKGILMNLLNPKVILFFLAFFPQFIDINSPNTAIQICFLGFLFIIQAFIIFSTVAILADKLSEKIMQKPRMPYIMNIIESVLFVAIGISLLFT